VSGATSTAWDDLARAAAERRYAGALTAPERHLLCFRVDGAPYAVPVESVRQIVRIRPITPIPRVAVGVRGVISLRGEILQVVDLRLRLGLAAVASDKATRIVVVQTDGEGRIAGLLVDEVREVLRVPVAAIGDAGADAHGIVGALCRHGDEFVSLVDLDRVLELGDA
jgi:purine-binding chemotaxis protein CheW